MVKLFDPRLEKVSPINALMPWVTETTAMTLATPITMPSVVRKLRSPCAKIDTKAARELSNKAKNISGLPQLVSRYSKATGASRYRGQ